MNTTEIRTANDQHLINVYGARKLALVRGEGVRVWDAEGREYLDFFAGIAVVALGHCHPRVVDALCEQARTLGHVSNLYYTEPQVRLAALLSDNSFATRWFLSNCGATANEAAFKIARRYWAQKGTPRPTIISALQSFHGRTLATVTATGQPKYHDGFQPLLPGIKYVPYNDVDSLRREMTPDVGAVILEPIQGEGGVRIPREDYLPRVRELCNSKNVLLILDEVQTGIGRTGKLFAHEHFGVTPDIITLAKALGNGVPIGAMGCTEEVASGFSVGSHASTFGGNPISAAAAVATLEEVLKPGFLKHVAEISDYFMDKLNALARRHEVIAEVRGKGLMIGVELHKPAGAAIEQMIERGIICGPAGPNVVRFVPPLIIEHDHVDRAMAAFDNVLEAI